MSISVRTPPLPSEAFVVPPPSIPPDRVIFISMVPSNWANTLVPARSSRASGRLIVFRINVLVGVFDFSWNEHSTNNGKQRRKQEQIRPAQHQVVWVGRALERNQDIADK